MEIYVTLGTHTNSPVGKSVATFGKTVGNGTEVCRERCALPVLEVGSGLHEGLTCLIPILMLGAEMLKRIGTAKCLSYSSPMFSLILSKKLFEHLWFFFKSWDDWCSGSPSHSQFLSSTKHKINPVIRSAMSKTS